MRSNRDFNPNHDWNLPQEEGIFRVLWGKLEHRLAISNDISLHNVPRYSKCIFWKGEMTL